jgi:hypothetical protein
MPIVHPCSAAECNTLTMGPYCLEHEQPAADAPPTRSRSVALAALVGATAGIAAAFVARARLPL